MKKIERFVKKAKIPDGKIFWPLGLKQLEL